MKKIRLECTCGETFEYEIDPDQIKPEFGTSGILPILVSHNDHFITVYLDENLNPRSIERVLLVKDQESSVFVKSTSLLDVKDTIAKLIKSDDPNSHFLRFLSQVIQKIKNSEDLFIAGRITGRYLWQKRREPLLKMGASFSIDPELILKTELIPIFEKVQKLKLFKKIDNQLF